MNPSPTDRHRALSAVLWTAVGLGLLALAFLRADWQGVLAAFAAARVWPWLPLAVASYLCGHLLRGVRCRLLVSRHVELALPTATNVVVLGYAANNLVPARLGEVVRAVVLAERGGIPTGQALAVTVLERILDALTILVLLAVTVVVVGLPPGMAEALPWAVVVLVAGACAFLGLTTRPQRLTTLVSWLADRLAPRWHDRLVRQALFVSAGTAYLREPRGWARVLVLSLAVWGCETGLFLFLLPAFGVPAHLSWALLAMAITNLALIFPSTPGYFGTFHFFCMQALLFMAVAPEVALGYAVVVHIAFFVPITLWGVGAMMVYGVELATLWSLRLRMRQAPSTRAGELDGIRLLAVTEPRPPEAPPSRFLVALGEATIHRAVAELGAAERERVVGDVAVFVAGQLRGLPPQLGLLFRVGMMGFRTLVLLATLRPFSALPASRRAAIVEAWAYGPIAVARQLFRAVRSTALLACYEHPSVLAALEPVADATAAEGR